MILTLPHNEKKLFLHVCCAPCSGRIIERVLDSSLSLTVFFYNPNISPETEYLLRKKEVVRFCKKKDVSFIDGDYNHNDWIAQTKGLEAEPEKGKRCDVCFFMRLKKTAQIALKNHFNIFATSLSISRWKDMEQVHRAGQRAAQKTPGTLFWDFNWRKDTGEEQGREISKRENFYQQTYCGCLYSKSN